MRRVFYPLERTHYWRRNLGCHWTNLKISLQRTVFGYFYDAAGKHPVILSTAVCNVISDASILSFHTPPTREDESANHFDARPVTQSVARNCTVLTRLFFVPDFHCPSSAPMEGQSLVTGHRSWYTPNSIVEHTRNDQYAVRAAASMKSCRFSMTSALGKSWRVSLHFFPGIAVS